MDPLSPAVLACNDRTRLSPPDRNAAALPVPPGGARVQRPNRGRRLERMLRQRARDVLPVGPAARTADLRPTSTDRQDDADHHDNDDFRPDDEGFADETETPGPAGPARRGAQRPGRS